MQPYSFAFAVLEVPKRARALMALIDSVVRVGILHTNRPTHGAARLLTPHRSSQAEHVKRL
jgi:hypothetical protein